MDNDLNKITVDCNNKTFKKMIFIFNALENNWNIIKKRDNYIFTKKHGGKKEIFSEKYLSTFVEENCDLQKIKCLFTS